jgi:hypothetical protein
MSGFTIVESALSSDGPRGDFIRINNKATNTNKLTKIKIHDNNFSLTYRTMLLDVYGNPVFGVFYDNYVYAVKGELFQFYGAQSNSGSHYWNTFLPEYGTANSFYVEDNIITSLSCGFGYVGQTGGRAVYRYNTVTMDGTNGWGDIHGAYSNTCAGQVAELYGNNIITSPPRSYYTFGQRGGWVLSYYNYGNLNNEMQVVNEVYGQTACSHPNNPQSDGPENSYYWNQRYGPSNLLATVQQSSPVATENAMFWVMRSGTFDGTGDASHGGGVGCGTLAQRPVTCTVGVGYWATDQNVTDISDMVGKNPATKISGTLYKCTSPNKWEVYYKPFTYPHPLRGENTQQDILLSPGWNWISFNVLPADISLSSVFSSILTQVEQVKGQTQSAIRSGGIWKGDLVDMNGIGQNKMYKVKVSAACTLTVTGTAVLSANPIPLGGGWNWVAFLPTTAMPIATALDSIKGQVLEVKSLTQSATYNGTTWSGTLSTMEPGKGYAIKMSGLETLTYPGGH